jgi:two-component system, response regulator RegA
MNTRVLIVDDDRHMVRTLSDILRLHGWETHGVYSAEDALAAVGADDFDVVVMDVRMAGMNGVEALKAMRALRPGIQVVLMTAYSSADLLVEAERAGALRVLPKPVALPGLLFLLTEAAGVRPSVLLVDSDASELEDLCDTLEQHGYECLRARTLDEALESLQAAHPPVVAIALPIDHLTPDESILAIKRANPAVVLILFSASEQLLSEAEHVIPSAWIRGTLRKPFAPEHLVRILDGIFAS